MARRDEVERIARIIEENAEHIANGAAGVRCFDGELVTHVHEGCVLATIRALARLKKAEGA